MTNPAYTPTELAHIVALCEPQVVVCLPGAGGENNVRAACATSGILVSEILFVEPDEEAYGLRKKVEAGPQSWMTLLSNEELNVSLTVLGVFSNRWLVFKYCFFRLPTTWTARSLCSSGHQVSRHQQRFFI